MSADQRGDGYVGRTPAGFSAVTSGNTGNRSEEIVLTERENPPPGGFSFANETWAPLLSRLTPQRKCRT